MREKQNRKVSKMSQKALWYNKFRINKIKIHSNNSRPPKNVPVQDNHWIDGIMIAPRTPGGQLSKELRGLEVNLRSSSKTKVKILEDTGTMLKSLLSSNPWQANCPRPKCIPCSTSEKSCCNIHNIVYKSTCKP